MDYEGEALLKHVSHTLTLPVLNIKKKNLLIECFRRQQTTTQTREKIGRCRCVNCVIVSNKSLVSMVLNFTTGC